MKPVEGADGEYDVSLVAFPDRVMRLKIVDGVPRFEVGCLKSMGCASFT